MRLLKCTVVISMLLVAAGCRGVQPSSAKPGSGGTEARTATMAPLPTAGGKEAPAGEAASAPPTPAIQENNGIWSKIDKALASEDYSAIVAEYRASPNPGQDLTAMYNLAMYNIYGQAGDDAKSLECLYNIPADYTGRHADLVAYWKFIHESYAQGRADNITFDEYKLKYYKSGKGVH